MRHHLSRLYRSALLLSWMQASVLRRLICPKYNYFQIHSGFADISPQDACDLAVGMDTGQYKRLVADVVIEKLSPIREEFIRIREEEGYLESVLVEGSEKARVVASKNWKDVQRLMGMIR